ncbi:MAG: ImmA/IrrE family metallo-endopeptidase, partial [Chloroflexi bacterium]|nr:ImmA/IrrE family metallo-endopeptidase [Chloroflexota bacterium]
ARYEESAFRIVLKQVRLLTRAPVLESIQEARRLCNGAGVALSLVEPLSKARLSGAAWWLSAHRPVIALSARHKTDDHLWFSLFHEAAHILLHSKKSVFVAGADGGGNDIEAEANAWASNVLVPRADWRGFVQLGTYTRGAVLRFAEEQGIAPGIVVGSLQHEGLLPWSHLNRLKVRLRWTAR